MRFIKTKSGQLERDSADSPEKISPALEQEKKSLFGRKKQIESDVSEVSFSESGASAVEKSPVVAEKTKKPGLFGRGKKAIGTSVESESVSESEEQTKTSEKKPSFPFWAKKEKAQVTAESSKPEKTKKTDSKNKDKAVKAQSGAIYLSTELENGTIIVWELTTKSLKQLPAMPKGKVAFSFSDQDYRFAVDGPLSNAKATGVALAEIGETVGIVNLSRKVGSVHATRMSRINESQYALAPGGQLFETGFRTKDDAGSIVVGALLKDQVDGQSLLILQHLGPNLEAGRIQLTLNPENIEYIVGQFMTREKVVRGNVKTLLYTNDELIALAKSAANYPSALTWNGISIAKLKAVTMLSTTLVCGAALAFAGSQYQEQAKLAEQLKQKESTAALAKEEKLKLLSQARESIVAGMQMDVNKLFETATLVHTPGAVVEVTANSDEFEYTLMIGAYSKEGDGKFPTDLGRVNALLDAATPHECEKTAQTTTNQGDQYEVKFTCSIERSGFSRYFN